MLLAVDAGNTNTKFGVFDGDSLVSKTIFPTADIGDAPLPAGMTAAIVCSVVPSATDVLVRRCAERGIDARAARHDADWGFKINYEPMTALGLDRVVNCFAASRLHGLPVVVCSFGTATTIDAVSSGSVLLPGVIAPGPDLMARSLHLYTAKLPHVEVNKARPFLPATTTADSIRSGVFNAQLGLIDRVVPGLKAMAGENAKVIATGGNAKMLGSATGVIDTVDDDLLLTGLRLLYEDQA